MSVRAEILSDRATRTPLSRCDRIDGAGTIVSRTPGKADIRATRYRMVRPNHGLTVGNAPQDMQFAAVHLWGFGAHDQWRDDRHRVRPAGGPGAVSIYDFRRSWVVNLADPFHTVNFELPRWKLDELTDTFRMPRVDALRCPEGTHDDVILHLALALMPALERPWEANPLFVDYMLTAVASHLVRSYGGTRLAPHRPAGLLAPWQERRVKEMMTAGPAQVSLAELAEACALSISYFSRAFRRTVGLPPHRWLLEQRVIQAKALLETSRQSLSEIALACGFADQSHFTRVFSRFAGHSPGAWRRMRED